jgi:hypothetical protein
LTTPLQLVSRTIVSDASNLFGGPSPDLFSASTSSHPPPKAPTPRLTSGSTTAQLRRDKNTPPPAADNLFGASPSTAPSSDTMFGGAGSSPRGLPQAADNLFGAPPSAAPNSGEIFDAPPRTESAPPSVPLSQSFPRSSPREPLQAAESLFEAPPASDNFFGGPPRSDSAPPVAPSPRGPLQAAENLFGAPPAPNLFSGESSSPHGRPADSVFGAPPSAGPNCGDFFGASPPTENAPPPSFPLPSPREPSQSAENLFGAPPSPAQASETLFNGEASSPRAPPPAVDNLFGVPPSAASASPSLFNTSSSSPRGPPPAVEDVFGAAPQDSRDLFGAPPRTESAPPAVPVAPRAPRVVSPRAPPQAADNLFGAPPSATPASDAVFGGSSSSPREPLQATDNIFGAPPSATATAAEQIPLGRAVSDPHSARPNPKIISKPKTVLSTKGAQNSGIPDSLFGGSDPFAASSSNPFGSAPPSSVDLFSAPPPSSGGQKKPKNALDVFDMPAPEVVSDPGAPPSAPGRQAQVQSQAPHLKSPAPSSSKGMKLPPRSTSGHPPPSLSDHIPTPHGYVPLATSSPSLPSLEEKKVPAPVSSIPKNKKHAAHFQHQVPLPAVVLTGEKGVSTEPAQTNAILSSYHRARGPYKPASGPVVRFGFGGKLVVMFPTSLATSANLLYATPNTQER